jgi:hypothetical protein
MTSGTPPTSTATSVNDDSFRSFAQLPGSCWRFRDLAATAPVTHVRLQGRSRRARRLAGSAGFVKVFGRRNAEPVGAL